MKWLMGLCVAVWCQHFGALPVASANPGSASSFVTEQGRTLPPVGYVRFCAENPSECKADTLLWSRTKLAPENWSDLYRINRLVNGKVKPVSDEELYGKAEYWTYPTNFGDCEDYLLLKKRYLEELGFPSSALLITVVLDERDEGHAVLTVASTTGDYVLDNRRDDILLWNETHYTFLKRQSQRDPKTWMALVKQPTVSSGAVGTNSGN